MLFIYFKVLSEAIRRNQIDKTPKKGINNYYELDG